MLRFVILVKENKEALELQKELKVSKSATRVEAIAFRAGQFKTGKN